MKLSTYLTENNLSASGLAARVGVPPSTISRLIARQRSPLFMLMVRIRNATDGVVTLDDLAQEFGEEVFREAAQ